VTSDKPILARVEHDLRAALAIISGYSEALLLRGDDETRRAAAIHIQEAVDRLTAGIAELLELAGRTPDGGQTGADPPR